MISAHSFALVVLGLPPERPVLGDPVLAYVALGDADSGKAEPCQPAES
ncbi:hypothetical protein [Streptomyces sp. NPDC003943]